MPYVDRSAGAISGAYANQQYPGQEYLADNSPEWLLIQAERTRSAACSAIDAYAGTIRSTYVSDGALVDQEYTLTERQARAWRDAGYTGPAPACVQSWADAAGLSTAAAADDILTQADGMYAALESIRAARLSGKAAVNAATDQAGVEAAQAAALAALEILRA